MWQCNHRGAGHGRRVALRFAFLHVIATTYSDRDWFICFRLGAPAERVDQRRADLLA
jgi:hypothetical protein